MRTSYNTLLVTIEDGVADVVLNRPEARNALSHEMEHELDVVLDEAEVDKSVRAVVLRGAGKVFSAGHDLKEENLGKKFSSVPDPDAIPSHAPSLPRAWYFRKPLIAGVHAYVGPAAVGLVACCDFVIAGEGTRFSLEVMKGGSAPGKNWYPLYQQLPMRVIEKLFLMGGWMDAREALQFQFVQRVLPQEKVTEEALRWARTAARVPNFAAGKWSIRRAYSLMGLSMLLQLEPIYRKTPPEEPQFARLLREKGLQAAVAQRDAGFDDDVVRV